MRIFFCFFVSLLSLSGTYGQTLTPAGPLDLCPGGTQLLTVNAAPAGTAFQWQLNAVDIGGAVSSTYLVTSAGSYRVILNSPGPVIDTLGPVVVVARPAPIPTFSFTNNNSCSGTSIQFTAGAVTGGAGPYTYSWNFGDAGGALGSSVSHVYTDLDVVSQILLLH